MSRIRHQDLVLDSSTCRMRRAGKYLYDFEQEAFQGLPRSLQKQVEGNPDVARAISKARDYLNVSQP
jgi:hypothetical protein